VKHLLVALLLALPKTLDYLGKARAASNAELRTLCIAIEIGPSVGHAFLPISEGEK